MTTKIYSVAVDPKKIKRIENRFKKLIPLLTDINELRKLTRESPLGRLYRGTKKYVNGDFKEGAILAYKSFGYKGYKKEHDPYTDAIREEMAKIKEQHKITPFVYLRP